MKKTFLLQEPGKADARVRDQIRHEVNKYVRRERRKPLPEGYDWWNFSCRVGSNATDATALELDAVGAAIDTVAGRAAPSVFIEILKQPALRPGRRSRGGYETNGA